MYGIRRAVRGPTKVSCCSSRRSSRLQRTHLTDLLLYEFQLAPQPSHRSQSGAETSTWLRPLLTLNKVA